MLPASAAARGNSDGIAKCRLVGHDMIGWKQQHDGVRIVFGHDQRGNGGSRRGISTRRFEHDGAGLQTDFQHLLGHKKPMVVVAQKNWRSDGRQVRAQYRFLNHRAAAMQGE